MSEIKIILIHSYTHMHIYINMIENLHIYYIIAILYVKKETKPKD